LTAVARVAIDTGVTLEVQEFGSGPAVVFVHGGAMTHRVWDHPDRLPNARLETFEDSAHCPHIEEPRRFNEALLAFLDA
jgi:pimeloyl-ACP methyl ester carboxylesterase